MSVCSAIRIIHGNHDRATSHLATEKFWERIPNKDKEIGIYEGYEHVMMKVSFAVFSACLPTVS